MRGLLLFLLGLAMNAAGFGFILVRHNGPGGSSVPEPAWLDSIPTGAFWLLPVLWAVAMILARILGRAGVRAEELSAGAEPVLPEVAHIVAESYGIAPDTLRFRRIPSLNIRSHGLWRSRWTIDLNEALLGDRSVLAGILAHEMAHLKLRHEWWALGSDILLPMLAGLGAAESIVAPDQLVSLATTACAMLALQAHRAISRRIELRADQEAAGRYWRAPLLWSIDWYCNHAHGFPWDDNSWEHPTLLQRYNIIRKTVAKGPPPAGSDSLRSQRLPDLGGSLSLLRQSEQFVAQAQTFGLGFLVAFAFVVVAATRIELTAAGIARTLSGQATTATDEYVATLQRLRRALDDQKDSLRRISKVLPGLADRSEAADEALSKSNGDLDVKEGGSVVLDSLKRNTVGLSNAIQDSHLKDTTVSLGSRLDALRRELLGNASGTAVTPAPTAAAATPAVDPHGALEMLTTDTKALQPEISNAKSTLDPALKGLLFDTPALKDQIFDTLDGWHMGRNKDGEWDRSSGDLAQTREAVSQLRAGLQDVGLLAEDRGAEKKGEARKRASLVEELKSVAGGVQSLQGTSCNECDANEYLADPGKGDRCLEHCGLEGLGSFYKRLVRARAAHLAADMPPKASAIHAAAP